MAACTAPDGASGTPPSTARPGASGLSPRSHRVVSWDPIRPLITEGLGERVTVMTVMTVGGSGTSFAELADSGRALSSCWDTCRGRTTGGQGYRMMRRHMLLTIAAGFALITT